ncbi:hypothetical protein SAY87_020924 [Trapa incisa]|uniref:HTH myb-type domain-containing protein n=1 Tax=Trapa incisa TaxID=236973 RepID=A0AAN7JRH9_9MYRT|nr:hypothetical protein SAY87_020924 [Trapa incisa]
MGSLPPELCFGGRPAFVPRAISDLIRDISADDLIRRLEDEMRKIDGLKRELPICMVLLRGAIASVKLEAVKSTVKPVTAEFIPLKKDCDDTEVESTNNKEKDTTDDNLDTLDLQLCSFDNNYHEKKIHAFLKNESTTAEDVLESCKSRTAGREFMQLKVFSAPVAAVFPCKEDKVELSAHSSLSLFMPGRKNSREENASAGTRTNFGQPLVHTAQSISRSEAPQQSARKQRRCWSPELHRRFVNALQQLGGSQAATPKQIRELMQVEGLTNDEVKSHLQKYRLHTRRLPIAAASSSDERVCALGSLWQSHD